MRKRLALLAWIPISPAAAAPLVLVLLLLLSIFPVTQGVARNSTESDVRIGVMGLFHPREFEVAAIPGHAIVLQAGEQSIVLEKSSGVDSASIHASGAKIVLSTRSHSLHATSMVLSGRSGGPVDFTLAIPGKISRRYHGTLEIKSSAGTLTAIVTMDREVAVASIVAAESDPDTSLEALKAQAVATRSYLVSGRGRHLEFDFCDTTHCQFLREPPAPGSAVAEAVAATRGLVLAHNSQPFPAMYTRSCSGHTRTAAQLGLSSADYPYYSVDCQYCIWHPARWTARLSTDDAAALRSSDESSRLRIDRRLGWEIVPSNDFVSKKNGEQVILQGTGYGHGIGLCQSGAKAMAGAGASFREILSHYYPNTTVMSRQNIVSDPRGLPDSPGN